MSGDPIRAGIRLDGRVKAATESVLRVRLWFRSGSAVRHRNRHGDREHRRRRRAGHRPRPGQRPRSRPIAVWGCPARRRAGIAPAEARRAREANPRPRSARAMRTRHRGLRWSSIRESEWGIAWAARALPACSIASTKRPGFVREVEPMAVVTARCSETHLARVLKRGKPERRSCFPAAAGRWRRSFPQ